MYSRVVKESLDEFNPLRRPSEPVLFKNGVARWPALARWSPEYLISAVGRERVRVCSSQSGEFKYNPDGSPVSPGDQRTIDDVLFEEVARWIIEEAAGAPKYYVTKFGLSESLPPQLLADLDFPATPRVMAPSIWFGSAGTSTPLHFDSPDNLHCQIYGSKRWVLFSPYDTPYLYPYPEDDRYSHVSHVDLANPDFGRFPLFRQATPLEVVLEPGDMIFVPAFWWHYVRSRTISVSVNRWWHQEVRQLCTPNAVRLLRTHYRQSVTGAAPAGELAPAEWMATAHAILEVNALAAVLMAACALRRFESEPIAADAAPRNAGADAPWAALLTMALDVSTTTLAVDDARRCVEALSETLHARRTPAERGDDAVA